MKKISFIVTLILVFILAGCGSQVTNSSSKGGKTQLLLAAEGTAMYYAYIAREKGYFKNEGIDVELVTGKGGTYVVQQVGAGTVDVGITAVSALLPAWDKGIDIQAVYQINVKNLFDFMVPKNSPIKDIRQLKGKVIGISDLGGGEVPMVRSILTSVGLNPDRDVTLRAVGTEATSILAAFDKGAIQAYSGGAHDLIALYAKGFESTSLIPEGYKSLPSTAIIANGKTVEKQPELVEKIARAVAKATDFSIKNPDEAYNVMKKAVPEQYTDEKVGRLFLDTFIGLSTPLEPDKGYGYIYQDSWEKFVQQFSVGENPVVKNKIDLNKYLNASFLEKANNF
jgi:NitT/TauT family transport system substrate-binding protein